MNKIYNTMEKNNLVNTVNNILDGTELPQRKVKIEKRERGLYERTKESTILLTEDNKIMLTD